MSPETMHGKVMELFRQLAHVPRPSGAEEQAAAWVCQWAERHGFGVRRDAAGNLAVDVPGAGSRAGAASVALQGHLDMVCEKTPDSAHDFTQDPIRLVEDGEWLCADGTTLGADNGMGLCLAMAAATELDDRPPLELIFTVDEESGLTGAQALEPGFVRSGRLINLDSEDDAVLIIGCAGGQNLELIRHDETHPVPGGWEPLRVEVGGLMGGHSGVDIHLRRANAIKLLGRLLGAIKDEAGTLMLGSLSGGSAHNAIPRDAQAEVWVPSGTAEAAIARVGGVGGMIRHEYAHAETPDQLVLRAGVNPDPSTREALPPHATHHFIRFLAELPDGPLKMSDIGENLVDTSSNLAQANIVAGDVTVLISQRSLRTEALAEQEAAVHRLADSFGAGLSTGAQYPPWTPATSSPLLEQVRLTYERTFGHPPRIEVIHAGLECGLIGERQPGLDMVSFGPTIRDPHSPSERVNTATVERIGRLLARVLEGADQR